MINFSDNINDKELLEFYKHQLVELKAILYDQTEEINKANNVSDEI